MMLPFILSSFLGYLIGCLQPSFFISKFIFGFDIRDKGTGNAGASNMVTTIGWKIGLVTGFVDVLKAFVAVWLIGECFHSSNYVLSLKIISGSFAILGHIYPFFMGFKGGKGVASYLGMLIGINPILGISLTVLLLVLTIITNYISLASILIYSSFPLYVLYTNMFDLHIFYILLLLSLIGIFKHKPNIINIIKKQETGFWEVLKGKHKKQQIHVILDFDSTIITTETLDELAKISLKDDPQMEVKVNEISLITEKAMNGEIHFMDALNERINILNATQVHLDQLKKILHNSLSKSFKDFDNYIGNNINNIYIVSGGFTELIYPVVKKFGIKKSHIFANKFTFNKQGIINGVDPSEFLAKKPGKIDAVKSLNLKGIVIVIGDGWTDYQIKESGLADYFIAYIESISRKAVIKKGDIIAKSFIDVSNFIDSIKK